MSKRSILEYRGDVSPVWCAFCGDYAVLTSLYQVFQQKDLAPEEIVLVSGIGCSSRLPHFVKAYGFHGVHGRTLPTAMGIKLANPRITVIAVAGDGDGFGIGLGHFIHTARRNPDLTYLVMDNSLYAQTKGQISPTTCPHRITPSTPYGAQEEPINPIALAILSGATFVGRAYSGKPELLTDLMLQAIEHPGFALIQIVSPCVTFNPTDTYRSLTQKSYLIPDHPLEDKAKALELAQSDDRIALGLFYRIRRPTLEEAMRERVETAQREGSAQLSELVREFNV
jgi:2-oxoglutarate ferredoxin oxidoreductase subunit beta